MLAVEVVAVVGGHHGDAGLAVDLDERGVDPGLVRNPVGLQLQVVAAVVEALAVLERQPRRRRQVAPRDRLADLAVEAARQHDQPLVVLPEELPVDPRLVVETVEVGLGDEPAEVPVAGLVHRQHREVEGPLVGPPGRCLVEAAAGREVELAADDRLDAGRLPPGVELDRAEEVAVVGHGDRRHLQLDRPLEEGVELVRPVEEAVLGVEVEVDERVECRHRGLDVPPCEGTGGEPRRADGEPLLVAPARRPCSLAATLASGSAARVVVPGSVGASG